MKVLHLLASGGVGGIETLCKDYGQFSKNENIFLFIWKGGCTADEMKNSNQMVIELNASKKNILEPWKKICSVCAKERVEAVVVHHAAPIAHLYLLLLKKKFSGLRTIAYAHGNAENMRGGSGNKGLAVRRWLIKLSLQRADQVIAISHSVKISLERLYKVDGKKIRVVYNGVNVKKFAEIPHRKHDGTELIYVGRLIQGKGVQIILKALALQPEDLDIHFSVAGDGDYRNELEKLTLDLQLQNRVTFLKNCRNIQELLAGADIFVHAPILEEGFGITIVEAMAAGLICICADSGAIPEIIRDGENGILFEKGNIQELSRKILTCLPNQAGVEADKLQKIRKEAREAAKEFEIELFSEALDRAVCGSKL